MFMKMERISLQYSLDRKPEQATWEIKTDPGNSSNMVGKKCHKISRDDF